MGLARFVNETVGVDLICTVELVLLDSDTLKLVSHAIVEQRRSVDRSGTGSNGSPSPPVYSLAPSL